MIESYTSRYVDFDIYGTLNMTRMVGVNLGYRSMDLTYLVDRYTGELKMDGVYVSGVVRF